MNQPLFTLQQAAGWIPGAKLVGQGSTDVLRVHTDSRSIAPGDLFVALKGETFDGHDFLGHLKALGVQAALAEHGLSQAELQGLIVSDSRLALGQLAQGHRASLPLHQLIAVTGSNGKTTVTQMLASILREHCGDAASWTQGNFNNEIGVPLTLLRLRPHHRCAVIEMGMNHPGEIQQLARWAQPTVALVNNAQREHQEFMHSIKAVAQENGSVLTALPIDGVAVFPAADEHSALWRELANGRRCLTFGDRGDVRLSRAKSLISGWQVALCGSFIEGEIAFELDVPGRHNLENAMAAATCALAAGVSSAAIVRGLGQFQPVSGRSQVIRLQRQQKTLTLVDDTYNANPDSVRAAIDVLVQLPAPHLLILGDMGEVGDQGPQFHTEVGSYASQRGIEHVLTHGTMAALAAKAHGRAHHHDDLGDLCREANQLCERVSSILVKGSRFMKMERVVQHLKQTQESTTC
jgi:UDP-N-acetylmuramoyl-tripeptide--D-alanyl-D-alanine ligase